MSDRWWCGICGKFVELDSVVSDESHEHSKYLISMRKIPKRAAELLKAEGAAEEREACAKEADRFADKSAFALMISEHIRARYKEERHG